MKNLIIIPARKGSKRIKNKNLYKVNKKPLIYWTINLAKKLKKNKFDTVVSTNCNKIKKICKSEKITYLNRSRKISGEKVSMHEVIFDTIKKTKKKYKYIILLQPTSPLRKLNLIYKAINILDKKIKFDSLISLASDNSYSGKIQNNLWKPDYDLNKRTQDIKDKFIPTGNLFVYRYHLYKNKIVKPKNTYGLVLGNDNWIDIDCENDLKLLGVYLIKSKNKRLLLYNK